jgi:ribosomal protein S18 acetylase RimI-like enzyme
MIRHLEELAMNAWPALQTNLYDGWVLRFADGFTKRANCVSPLYNSSLPLQVKLDFCEKEYSPRNLPVVYKLTPENPEELDQELEKRGYSRSEAVAVKTLSLEDYISRKNIGNSDITANGESDAENATDIEVASEFSENWLADLIKSSDLCPKDQITKKRLLQSICTKVISVSKQVHGSRVGFGYGVIENDFMGIFGVFIAEEQRGNGYGREIMNRLLSAAAKRGIKVAYLQVAVGNMQAVNLYESLGFKKEYQYWYRVKKVKIGNHELLTTLD